MAQDHIDNGDAMLRDLGIDIRDLAGEFEHCQRAPTAMNQQAFTLTPTSFARSSALPVSAMARTSIWASCHANSKSPPAPTTSTGRTDPALSGECGDAGHVFAYALGLAAVGEVRFVVHAVRFAWGIWFQCFEQRAEAILCRPSFRH